MKIIVCVFALIVLVHCQAKSIAPWARFAANIRTNSWRSVITVNRNTKIVGGSYATNGQLPFQVGMYLDGTGFCGGSLISDTVILTAGHCVVGTRTFTVHAGSIDVDLTTTPAQIVTATQKILHEFYSPTNLLNDIGLVILDAPLTGTNIGAIRLPNRLQIEETFEGAVATASGWGRVSDDDGRLSQFLKFVNVNIISNVDCEAIYGPAVNDAKLCIDTNSGFEGTCFGDSGGPLTITEADGISTAVGITSFVDDGGCQTGNPAGFTRVSMYIDWISQHSGIPVRP
ncbi:brachyurin-like [Neocloeon triangulifer]|uniref:brachyurin-like n=1 Tax=Neocloeon triangulifer TaxID=2078957 RepID=UPI00286F195E|nr:brachyurin-like [Neocloeon triangulifer]